MREKIGIYVCECGPNIGSRVHIDKIMEEISKLEDFKDAELVVRNHKLLCSVDGKKFLEDEINEHQFTHLVVAACSPRDHDSTFINVCKKTDLNPYLYRIVNIREQCAWVISDKDKATEKAVNYIHAAMDRVRYQTPLYEKQLDSNPDVLIVGGGIAGVEAALTLAGEDRKIFLIDKETQLGGTTLKLKELLKRQGETLNIIQEKLSDIKSNENIKILTNTVLKSMVGFLGNYEIELEDLQNGDVHEFLVGAVVLANGYDLLDASKLKDFQYKKEDNVFTALEIEEMFLNDGKITLRDGSEPKSVAMVHCVGRKNLGYCSKICCNYLLKIANRIKMQNSNIKISDLYKHMVVPHKDDQKYFEQSKVNGIDFIKITDVELKGTTLGITTIDGNNAELKPDMVILATGVVPSAGNETLAEMASIDLDEFGFYQEAHLKINPVSTNTDGVFIIGSAKGPTDISESMLQAQAAAGKIFTQLIPGQKITPEVMVSEVLEAYCTGCKSCLDICAYGAIYFDEDAGISVVNEAICRGCGNCVGICPSGSIRTKHFTNPQLYQEVKEALR